jgi:hypothetical protein
MSIVIKRPVADVFQFVENPANDSIWRSGVVASDQETTEPSGLGTTGTEVFRLLGRDFETTWEITEYEPNHKVAYRSTSGTFAYEGVWLYVAVDGGTRISFVLDWTLKDRAWAGRMSDRLLEIVDEKMFASDLRALKKLLEA